MIKRNNLFVVFFLVSGALSSFVFAQDRIRFDLGIIPDGEYYSFERAIKLPNENIGAVTRQEVSCDCFDLLVTIKKEADKPDTFILKGKFPSKGSRLKIDYSVNIFYKNVASDNEKSIIVEFFGLKEQFVSLDPIVDNFLILNLNQNLAEKHKVIIREDVPISITTKNKLIDTKLTSITNKEYQLDILYPTDKIGAFEDKLIFTTDKNTNIFNVSWSVKHPMIKEPCVLGGMLSIDKTHEIRIPFEKRIDEASIEVTSEDKRLEILDCKLTDTEGIKILVLTCKCKEECNINTKISLAAKLDGKSIDIPVVFNALFVK